MKFDFKRMLESKRHYGERVASRSMGEKLRILDALRERELALRGKVPAIPRIELGDSLARSWPPIGARTEERWNR